MTTALPPWLVVQLEADGIYDSATRLSRKAKPRRCRRCGTFTLAGLDDLSRPTWLDYLPTTSGGELFALLVGRGTYALDCGELYPREALHIEGRPADLHPVHVAHDCNGPPMPVNEKYAPKRIRTNYDGPIPF
jgi:hypothetical protein